MKTSEYLYGVSPKSWATLHYKDALEYRILMAKKLKKELVNELYDNRTHLTYEKAAELDTRIDAIIKAIEFNENLLKELKE